MGIGVFALVFAVLALIAGSFVGRFAAARLLGLRDVGIFGLRRATEGGPVLPLRRYGAHAGGPLGAYVFPVVLFTVAFQLAGEPVATTAIEVMPEMPAEEAGLRDGDRIFRIEDEPVAEWEAIRQAVNRRPNQPTRIEVEQGGQHRTLEITPNAKGQIGVKPVMSTKPMGLGKSLARAAIEPLHVVLATLTAVVRISTGIEEPKFVGSGAVAREIDKAHERDPADAIYLVALVAAYVWPVFVVLEVLLAAGMWRARWRHKPHQVSGPRAAAG